MRSTPTDGTDPAPAVRVQGVSKRYGDRQAVDDVSLDIHPGEFFGLLGPNGAGKSTLVEIMEGLRQADSGSVALFGRSPWPRDTALLPRIGVQTQSSAFFVRQTAHEHLRTVAALYGVSREAAEATLESVGLSAQRDIRPPPSTRRPAVPCGRCCAPSRPRAAPSSTPRTTSTRPRHSATGSPSWWTERSR